MKEEGSLAISTLKKKETFVTWNEGIDPGKPGEVPGEVCQVPKSAKEYDMSFPFWSIPMPDIDLSHCAD